MRKSRVEKRRDIGRTFTWVRSRLLQFSFVKRCFCSSHIRQKLGPARAIAKKISFKPRLPPLYSQPSLSLFYSGSRTMYLKAMEQGKMVSLV